MGQKYFRITFELTFPTIFINISFILKGNKLKEHNNYELKKA